MEKDAGPPADLAAAPVGVPASSSTVPSLTEGSTVGLRAAWCAPLPSAPDTMFTEITGASQAESPVSQSYQYKVLPATHIR